MFPSARDISIGVGGRLHVVTSTGRILWPHCKPNQQQQGSNFFGLTTFTTVTDNYDRGIVIKQLSEEEEEEEPFDDGLDEDEAFDDGVEGDDVFDDGMGEFSEEGDAENSQL